MKPGPPSVLALNGGSSSIRFAVYAADQPPQLCLSGKIDRIGLPATTLTVHRVGEKSIRPRRLAARERASVADFLLDWLGAQPVFASIQAVGHRVVHGLMHSAPERISPELIAELRRITPYDPVHLPREIELIEAVRRRHPRLPQVACFDTAFHHGMPPVARLLPIPRRYAAQGVRRFGFHGLSCAFLVEELRRRDPAAARGRVILAHLGNGASLTAVHRGLSLDTSMGFTPASGLVMGTRSGDLDPGLPAFLARRDRMTPAQFERMVQDESGLLGVSGTSSDMRDLLAREQHDPRAAQAVELFCYQVKKWLGAYTAVLEGLDALVFAGGIGENSPAIRSRICAGLGFLGLQLDPRRNARNAPVISPAGSQVKVHVIPTDEELMIARSVSRMLPPGPPD